MTTHHLKIRDPLTVIAIFSMLTEASAAVSLPYIHSEHQGVYVWFLIVFPSILVTLFFITLNFNNKTLYSPTTAPKEQSQPKPRQTSTTTPMESALIFNAAKHTPRHSLLFSKPYIRLSTHHPKQLIFLPKNHSDHDSSPQKEFRLTYIKPTPPFQHSLEAGSAPIRNFHLIDLSYSSLQTTPSNSLREALQAYSKKTCKHKPAFHEHDIVLLLTHTKPDIDCPIKKRSTSAPKKISLFGHATVIIYHTTTHELRALL